MSTTATENSGAPAGDQPHGNGTDQGTESNNAQTPTIEELSAKVEELTKHSRKWEERAKENKAKADRLDEIEQASLSDAEKAQKAVQKAEQRATEAEARVAELETAVLRYKIAARFEMSDEDAELILTGSDEETMTKQAERFSERSAPSARTPRPNPSQGNRQGAGPMTPKDKFGEFLDQHL